MKFLIITHVNHTFKDGRYYGYGPYIREMNLWGKHVDEVFVLAPLSNRSITQLDEVYDNSFREFSLLVWFIP